MNTPSKEPEVKDEEVEDPTPTEGVVVPEEFQQKTHELLKGATKEHLAHVRDRVYAREDELRNSEMKKKGGKKIDFSTADMPSGE